MSARLKFNITCREKIGPKKKKEKKKVKLKRSENCQKLEFLQKK